MDDIFISLVINIIKCLQESGIGFGVTRLLKIAYLVEIDYVRRYGERVSTVDWVYYKFGPYIMDFETYLSHQNIDINDDDYLRKVSLLDTTEVPQLSHEVSIIIERIIDEHGLTDLQELLDYVYFDTEPMIKAKERGEKLDFSVVKSREHYKIYDLYLDEAEKRELIQRLREKRKYAKPI